MPRLFIIDTNVLVAGLLTRQPDSATATLLDAMLNGNLFFMLSAELLAEYRAVLLRPKIRRLHGLSEPEVDGLLTELAANALVRNPPADTAYPSPDPNDAHLWALLAADPDAVLVTGDKLLLEKPRPGSVILSPAEALSIEAKSTVSQTRRTT